MLELERLGVTVSERTIRFYVANNLIPQPLKKPFAKADGRVSYFPRSSLLLVQRIMKWQEEGYKLKQIQNLLNKPSRLETIDSTAPEGWRKKMAFRFLRNWYGPARRRLLSEFSARVSSEDSDLVLGEAGRLRLARELSLMMEEEAALPLVGDYFQKLSVSEQQVWLERFRGWQREGDGSEEGTFGYQSWTPYQQLVGDLLLGLIPVEEYERRISSIEARVREMIGSSPKVTRVELEVQLQQLLLRVVSTLSVLKTVPEPLDPVPLLDALASLKISLQALVQLRSVAQGMAELSRLQTLNDVSNCSSE